MERAAVSVFMDPRLSRLTALGRDDSLRGLNLLGGRRDKWLTAGGRHGEPNTPSKVIRAIQDRERVMNAMVRQASAAPGAAKSQALRDLDTFRQFLTGGSFYALFDAPWAPLYLIVLALLHPLLGLIGLVFALVLLGIPRVELGLFLC